MAAYGEQRYGDALDAVRRRPRAGARQPGPPLQLRVLRRAHGETGDDVFDHLKKAVELFPPFREQARGDDDLAAVRDDPRFEEALR